MIEFQKGKHKERNIFREKILRSTSKKASTRRMEKIAQWSGHYIKLYNGLQIKNYEMIMWHAWRISKNVYLDAKKEEKPRVT